MRKLYNHSKGKIHPSPPPPPSSSATPDHHLFVLPLAISTLAAALAPEDQEVLAYLLSISATTNSFSSGSKPNKKCGGGDHPPQFNCDCFDCYTSFWVRWDSSPNRKVIHEIIDAYEDGLIHRKKNGKNKKERKNKVFASSSTSTAPHAPPADAERVCHAPSQIEPRNGDCEGETDLGLSEKGSVGKIFSFIGDRIWGVWGI